MASGQNRVLHQLERLFTPGTVAGLSQWRLLSRYVSRRDEAAFEALVARHGPMVLGVCRQLLRDPNDVDDAFQATFLVLVRNAGTLRRRDLLGNWLYGVAHRGAIRSRRLAARRPPRPRDDRAPRRGSRRGRREPRTYVGARRRAESLAARGSPTAAGEV